MDVKQAARNLLDTLDRHFGIARLSDDKLRWECPECHQVTCDPDSCGKGAILKAADDLAEALRL